MMLGNSMHNVTVKDIMNGRFEKKEVIGIIDLRHSQRGKFKTGVRIGIERSGNAVMHEIMH